MTNLNYLGVNYPTRTFNVILDNKEQQIIIANESLNEALINTVSQRNSEKVEYIDNLIYFYVENEAFNLDANEICQNHLDEPIHFLAEIN
jgi:hypothetical protein